MHCRLVDVNLCRFFVIFILLLEMSIPSKGSRLLFVVAPQLFLVHVFVIAVNGLYVDVNRYRLFFFILFLFCRWICKFPKWSCNPKALMKLSQGMIYKCIILKSSHVVIWQRSGSYCCCWFYHRHCFCLLQSSNSKCLDLCNITWSSTRYLFVNQFQWRRKLE